MASVINTKKGFKVIKMTLDEAVNICNFGYVDHGVKIIICDDCNTKIHENEDIYYVPVLNSALCKRCYDSWYASAKYYEEDARCENMVFNHYYNIFKQIGAIDMN